MRTALYSQIDPPAGKSVAWVITEAQRRCHITLMPFDGWDDADLGNPSNRGPVYRQSRVNMALIHEVMGCLEQPGPDWPNIHQIRRDLIPGARRALFECK